MAAVVLAVLGLVGLATPAHAASTISVSSTTVVSGDTFTINFEATPDSTETDWGENFYSRSSTIGVLQDITTIESCTGNVSPCTASPFVRVPVGGVTAGTNVTGSITLRINPGTPPGSFILRYQLYANGVGGDATEDGPTITVTDPPPPTADIDVDLTAQPRLGILVPYLRYTLTARNTGPDPATAATLTATLPSGATATNLSAGCTQSTGTITCAYGPIANGASAAKTFQVPMSLLSLGNVTVTGLRTTGAPTDPDLANDNATATCNVLSIVLATCP